MTPAQERRGSLWHRWDPHIHAPGTVLNDQFRGADPWDEYLSLIERSDPPIRALGVTDYFSLATYMSVLEKRKEGRLSGVELVFPNVEMRYGIGTERGAAINVHLLVSPDDKDHVAKIQRFLRDLTFRFGGEEFRCDRDDLVRLGRLHKGKELDEAAALVEGTNQFKVGHAELRTAWDKSEWFRDNALIAVAAGSGDGTSGLAADASLAALRKEIERFAHIIFSGQPKQREFWLGQGKASLKELRDEWNGPKPCLHGSDAHSHEQVGAPARERLTWIKGDLVFESLRQACLEPEFRVFVGELPPQGALPSQVVADVAVTSAAWLTTPSIPLNSGLVGVIGARGSGKTALADFIASGSFAMFGHLSERSFVRRAQEHLVGSRVEINWADGGQTSADLGSAGSDETIEWPRIQYLSQQFVDRLCSSEGVSDALLTEIERVVYDAHAPEDRMGTTTFDEFLDLRTARGRAQRDRNEELLAEIVEGLSVQREKRASLPSLQKQRGERATAIVKDKSDRSLLLSKANQEHAKQLEIIVAASEQVRGRVEQASRRRAALLSLKDEVVSAKANATNRLRQLQQRYVDASLTPEQWSAFELNYNADPEVVLKAALAEAETMIRKLTGPTPDEVSGDDKGPPSSKSLLPRGANPNDQTLTLLEKEASRLRRLTGIDAENEKTLARLAQKISRDEAAVAQLDRDITAANDADNQIADLLNRRRDAYSAIFEGLLDEERELSAIYEPLRSRLQAEEGALGKLSFAVRRTVDLEKWATEGEGLLDLRTAGPFRGHGALADAARLRLLPAWEEGSSSDVAAAMEAFRGANEDSLRQHSSVDRKSDPAAYREWVRRVSAWLYGTGHIRIAYGVQYEGVEIERLSPGTRGIVLLLLYLALDRDDDRPLVIDQPEENLDPRSIFEELVWRFRRAKLSRQIIVVTHNANLVVNADADQVIVANCGPHRPGELPKITYQSGGLENAEIRRHVCEILEGGEDAFKERARRLRVRI